MALSASIQVGTRIIGAITLDAARVRGEGGPHDPRLVLPLTLTFSAADIAGPLVLRELTCSLHSSEPAFPSNQYGSAITVPGDRGHGYPATSALPQPVEARIPLSLPLLTAIEGRRHATPDNAFVGALRFTGTVAWVAQVYNALPDPLGRGSPTPIGEAPFAPHMGPLALLAPFDNTRIEDLTVAIPAAVWVGAVLPGLGYTHLRLVELTLPHSGGPLPAQVVADFDAARRDYDAGRYRESIQKCRDIRSAVEDYFTDLDRAYTPATGESGAKYVYNIVRRRLGLADTDPQYVFLRDTWNAWLNLASASHHTRAYTAGDARACLHLAAILLEYLTHLFSPPPLGVGPAGQRPWG